MDKAPHTAVIWLSAKVYDKLPNGDLSGKVAEEIKEITIVLDGRDKEDAVIKLRSAVEEIKRCLKPKTNFLPSSEETQVKSSLKD